jgi:hypothetical protein
MPTPAPQSRGRRAVGTAGVGMAHGRARRVPCHARLEDLAGPGGLAGGRGHAAFAQQVVCSTFYGRSASPSMTFSCCPSSSVTVLRPITACWKAPGCPSTRTAGP